MVSITRASSLRSILDQLVPGQGVTLVTCNTCVHFCGTGGRLAMDHLATRLEENGVPVLRKEVVTRVCLQEQLRAIKPEGTVVLMACSSGLASVKEAWPDANIVLTNITLGLGPYDPDRGKATLLIPFEGFERHRGEEYPKDEMEDQQ